MNSREIDRHLAALKTDGFTIARGLFSEAEVAVFRREATGLLEAGYGSEYLADVREQLMPALTPDAPRLSTLLEQPRCTALGFGLLGDDAIAGQASVTRFTGDTEWHRGPTDWDMGVKLLLYLEPLDGSNGALRALKGSHLWELSEQQRKQLKKDGSRVVATVIDTNPGDVIAFDLRVWHSSFHGGPFRHSCQFVYMSRPKTARFRKHYASLFRERDAQFAAYGVDAPAVHPDWLANADGDPVRQGWIDFLTTALANDAPSADPDEEDRR